MFAVFVVPSHFPDTALGYIYSRHSTRREAEFVKHQLQSNGGYQLVQIDFWPA
jgi:hypothetical protein